MNKRIIGLGNCFTKVLYIYITEKMISKEKRKNLLNNFNINNFKINNRISVQRYKFI